jgi:excisionase family DNA binding protein
MDIAELSQRLPTAHETARASEAASALVLATSQSGEITLKVTDDAHRVVLPQAVGQMVLDLLLIISRGEAVTFVPFGAELSTQQAADMLNVSRPFLVKLIETDQLKAHRVGTHRRIKAADVLDYRKQRETRQKAALKELARLGQEIDRE